MNLPIGFTTRPESDPGKVIHIKIIQGELGFPFSGLKNSPKKNQLIFHLEAQLHKDLQQDPNPYYIIDYGFEKPNTPGVLYNIIGDLYGCTEITQNYENLGLKSVTSSIKSNQLMTIESWKKFGNISKKHDSTTSVSDTDINKSKDLIPCTTFDLSPINTASPKDFLQSRYYSTLYSFNTPLSYFPKTALSRYRNMCKGQEAEIHLNELIMPLETLDEKYNTESNGNNHLIVNDLEKSYRDLYIKSMDGKEPRDFNLLKIRANQLQMLLRLELIAWSGESDFFDVKDNIKPAKKSLVRRKGKRVVPTFLGMGVGVGDVVETKPLQTNRAVILAIIDRMAIWDTLYASGSSYEFLVYVVVPYFNKRIPKTTKYIIERFKESSVKVKLKSVVQADSKKKEVKSTQEKYQKKLTRKPLPNKLSLDPAPAFSLKRSKSNATSKNLEKRQVDVSLSFSNEVTSSTSKLLQNIEPRQQKAQPIFTIKRAKTAPIQENPTASTVPQISQVAQTPIKQKREVILTPSKNDRQNSLNISGKLHALMNNNILSSPIQSPERPKLHKPGDPIAPKESPFFSSNIQESPIASGKSTDEDIDSDH